MSALNHLRNLKTPPVPLTPFCREEEGDGGGAPPGLCPPTGRLSLWAGEASEGRKAGVTCRVDFLLLHHPLGRSQSQTRSRRVGRPAHGGDGVTAKLGGSGPGQTLCLQPEGHGQENRRGLLSAPLRVDVESGALCETVASSAGVKHREPVAGLL